ncbi:hypothetical protein ACFQJC_04030 [Haloferax namakaokahaiae]|uniref:Uncharacterized protein n=1 Tax=Haloferax namakaokahaiae TaxID=1748331 RepID=A0ABD5ZC06_9EURY
MNRPSVGLPAAAGLVTTITALRHDELGQVGVLVVLWVILGVSLSTTRLVYIFPALSAVVISYLGWDTLRIDTVET